MTTEDKCCCLFKLCAAVVVHQGFFGFGLWDFGRSHLDTLYDFPFSCVLGVIEPTNVAFRVYPFVHFYF
jgi:hypothetical protein